MKGPTYPWHEEWETGTTVRTYGLHSIDTAHRVTGCGTVSNARKWNTINTVGLSIWTALRPEVLMLFVCYFNLRTFKWICAPWLWHLCRNTCAGSCSYICARWLLFSSLHLRSWKNCVNSLTRNIQACLFPCHFSPISGHVCAISAQFSVIKFPLAQQWFPFILRLSLTKYEALPCSHSACEPRQHGARNLESELNGDTCTEVTRNVTCVTCFDWSYLPFFIVFLTYGTQILIVLWF